MFENDKKKAMEDRLTTINKVPTESEDKFLRVNICGSQIQEKASSTAQLWALLADLRLSFEEKAPAYSSLVEIHLELSIMITDRAKWW